MSTVREIIEQHPETTWIYADAENEAGVVPVNMRDILLNDDEVYEEAVYEPGRGIFLIEVDGVPLGFPYLAELPASGGMTDDERARLRRERDEKREAYSSRYADACNRAESLLVDIVLDDRQETIATVLAAAALVISAA